MASPAGSLRGLAKAPSIKTGNRQDPPDESNNRYRFRVASSKPDAPSMSPEHDQVPENDIAIPNETGILNMASFSGILPSEVLQQLSYLTQGAMMPTVDGKANGQTIATQTTSPESIPLESSATNGYQGKGSQGKSKRVNVKGEKYIQSLLQSGALKPGQGIPQEVMDQLNSFAVEDTTDHHSVDSSITQDPAFADIPTSITNPTNRGESHTAGRRRKAIRRPKKFWKSFPFPVASQLGRRVKQNPQKHSVFWRSNPIPIELFSYSIKSARASLTPGGRGRSAPSSLKVSHMRLNVRMKLRSYQEKDLQSDRSVGSTKSDIGGLFQGGLSEAFNMLGTEDGRGIMENSLSQVLSFGMDDDDGRGGKVSTVDYFRKSLGAVAVSGSSRPSSPVAALERMLSDGEKTEGRGRPTSPMVALERLMFAEGDNVTEDTRPTSPMLALGQILLPGGGDKTTNLWDTRYTKKNPANDFTFFVPRESVQPSPTGLTEEDRWPQIKIAWKKLSESHQTRVMDLWDSADYEFKHDLELDEIEDIIIDGEDDEDYGDNLFETALLSSSEDEDEESLQAMRESRPKQPDKEARRWRLFFSEQRYLEKTYGKGSVPEFVVNKPQVKKVVVTSSPQIENPRNVIQDKVEVPNVPVTKNEEATEASPAVKEEVRLLAETDEAAMSQLQEFLRKRRELATENGDAKALSELEKFLEEQRVSGDSGKLEVSDEKVLSVLELYLHQSEEAEEEPEPPKPKPKPQPKGMTVNRSSRSSTTKLLQQTSLPTKGRRTERSSRPDPAGHLRTVKHQQKKAAKARKVEKKKLPESLKKKPRAPDDLLITKQDLTSGEDVLSCLRSFDEEIENIVGPLQAPISPTARKRGTAVNEDAGTHASKNGKHLRAGNKLVTETHVDINDESTAIETTHRFKHDGDEDEDEILSTRTEQSVEQWRRKNDRNDQVMASSERERIDTKIKAGGQAEHYGSSPDASPTALKYRLDNRDEEVQRDDEREGVTPPILQKRGATATSGDEVEAWRISND